MPILQKREQKKVMSVTLTSRALPPNFDLKFFEVSNPRKKLFGLHNFMNEHKKSRNSKERQDDEGHKNLTPNHQIIARHFWHVARKKKKNTSSSLENFHFFFLLVQKFWEQGKSVIGDI